MTWSTRFIERGDPGARLAPAVDLRAVHVPRGQVGQGPTAVVLVLDAHRAGSPGRQRRVAAAADLDRGFLIRTQHDTPRGPSRRPFHQPAYKSKTTAALAAKSGARGAIQDRYCHGLSASAASQRRTVAAEMSATIPAPTASHATSMLDHRDNGIPRSAGNSQHDRSHLRPLHRRELTRPPRAFEHRPARPAAEPHTATATCVPYRHRSPTRRRYPRCWRHRRRPGRSGPAAPDGPAHSAVATPSTRCRLDCRSDLRGPARG